MISWYKKFGLTGKLVLPMLVILPIIVASQVFFIRSETKSNAVTTAKKSAKATIDQYKILRGYYTKNIVKKVKSSGVAIKFHFDHKEAKGVLPLPATVIHDLSAELRKSDAGIRLGLFSDKPFPNRNSRKLDDFQKLAIAAVKANPDEPFVKEVTENNIPYVRVAIADKLIAEGCVNCHNNHPQTPFSNWKLGDVRGVLEAKVPIKGPLEAGSALAANVGWTVALSGLLIVGLMLFILTVFIIKPVKDLTVDLRKSSSSSVDGNELVDSSKQILKATENESANIQSTTVALEEITAMSSRSSEQAELSGNKAANSSEVANKGRKAVEDVGQSMHEIRSSTEALEKNVRQGNEKLNGISALIQEIAAKTNVINDIVFQTKLLSFNASVEAARAGEQGKGFAVVAEEVGNLAQMSGSAAGDINALIAESVKKVEEIVSEINNLVSQSVEKTKSVVDNGDKNVGLCEAVLGDILENTEEMRGFSSQIVNSAQEQLQGVKDINNAVSKIDKSSQNTASIAKETLSYAESIVVQSETLKQVVSELEKQVLGNRNRPDETEEEPVALSSHQDAA